MIEWTKPNGSNITTNEEKASIIEAEKLGWKRSNEVKHNDNSTTDRKRSGGKNRR
jgi:hypothetical protein